jgi:DNA-binding response OmpR family regulator
MKIAVLEDNPAILDFMKIALEMAGHNAYIYTNGSSFLASLFSAMNTLLQMIDNI